MKLNSKLLKAGMVSALVLLTAQAQADVVAAVTRNGNFFINSGRVPLDNSGGTVVNFSGSGRFIISYTAECAVGGGATYLDLDILVDNLQVSPTAGDLDAFCASNSTSELDGWVMAAVNAVANVGPGNHTVFLRARNSAIVNGPGSLGDSSLVIWQ